MAGGVAQRHTRDYNVGSLSLVLVGSSAAPKGAGREEEWRKNQRVPWSDDVQVRREGQALQEKSQGFLDG